MAETGNQRNLTKGEKTSTGQSHEDFSGASGVVEKLRQYYHRDNITDMRNTTRHYILSK